MVSTRWQQIEHHSVGFSAFNISISEHPLNANPENSNNLYRPGEITQDQKVSQLLAQKTAEESIFSYRLPANGAGDVTWCRRRAERHKFLS